jgi:putative cardiolipin synthase
MRYTAALHTPSFQTDVPPDLADVIEHLCEQHPQQSGFHLLKTGGDAFTARLALIQASRETIDLQYYILQDDLTGKLLVEDVLRAADRGVKVRILLDDLDFHRARESIMILNVHQNICIRIFNPAITRKQRWMNKLFRFSHFFERYSKRMHNKLLLADGAMAVAGGRNLGDEYFDARAEFAFNDLDVLALGAVTQAMQHSFNSYWNAKASYDLTDLIGDMPNERKNAMQRIALRKFYDDISRRGIVSKRRPDDILKALCEGELTLSWANAEFVTDSADKVLTPLDEADSPPMRKLEELLDKAKQEFVAVSPYFIPGQQGSGLLDRVVKRGINVRILTNSLASTDISAAHAAYSRYRPRMLEQGISLYELKPIPGKRTRHNLLRKGSSRSSLHAKMYVIDREWVMIGSMNLDPRSWRRNTEAVIIMHNPSLAEEVIEMFNEITAPECSFSVTLQDSQTGKLHWHGEEHGKPQLFGKDPCPGWFRRVCFWLFYRFAPEDQL